MKREDRERRDIRDHLLDEFSSGRMTRRELLRRASVLGLSLPTISALAAACTKASTDARPSPAVSAGNVRRGGTARLGAVAPTSDADPVTGYSDGGIRVAQTAAEYLTYPRPDYTLDPRLATKWTASNPQEWTFYLQQGAQWQDGSPFTADDVVATYDRLTNPKVNSGSLSAFQGILSLGNMESIDDHTVRFHLDRPYVDFPYLTSAFNYNAVILPKNYEVGSGTFTKGGIGTGAFILKEFSQEQAVFVRNPHYWAPGLPYLDGLVLKFFSDTPPMVLALQGEAIDSILTLPYAGSQALFSDPNVVILEDDSSEYRTLQMRVDRAPFSDVRVRQALALSLDRPALVQGLFAGKATVGNDHAFAPIFPTAPGPDEMPQRTQDYDLARKLLADAGFASGLDVTLTTEQYLEIPQYAVFVKQQAEPAGFNITLNIQSQNAFYGSGKNQPWLDVPLGITDWGPRGTASQVITPAYKCGAVWNSAHWCDESFDDLMESYDGELDEQKLKQIALQAAKIQNEAVPDIIAYWIKELRAVRKNLQGLATGPQHLDARSLWLSS